MGKNGKKNRKGWAKVGQKAGQKMLFFAADG
jgi:hypothetical protein